MKPYQFFKIYKRFYNKREKTDIRQSIRKERLRNFFYLTGYFMKTLEMAINHFFLNRSFCSQDFFYFASSFTG